MCAVIYISYNFSLIPVKFIGMFFLDDFHGKSLIGDISRKINSLPHMPVLGSSNSAANKDMMSNILTNGGYSFLIK